MSSVLLLTHEVVTARLAGPTIRSWELARVLARSCRVTLACPGVPDRSDPAFAVESFDGRLAGLVADHDVTVLFGFLLHEHEEAASARHLVVDLYDPFTLENLHMHKQEPLGQQVRTAVGDREVQEQLLRAGDMFLCASERQRDFWTGWLASAGRVNPVLHAADPSLHSLLRVVPFGLPENPP